MDIEERIKKKEEERNEIKGVNIGLVIEEKNERREIGNNKREGKVEDKSKERLKKVIEEIGKKLRSEVIVREDVSKRVEDIERRVERKFNEVKSREMKIGGEIKIVEEWRKNEEKKRIEIFKKRYGKKKVGNKVEERNGEIDGIEKKGIEGRKGIKKILIEKKKVLRKDLRKKGEDKMIKVKVGDR